MEPTLTHGPSSLEMAEEVLNGLTEQPKTLPPKYFYDERGSILFEEICDLDEYYVTRTEIGIMDTHVTGIAETIGPNALIIEFGSGSSTKTRYLLEHARDLAGYVPIDIGEDMLREASASIKSEFPGLNIFPLCADYTDPAFRVPDEIHAKGRPIVYFPGSTIGNLEPGDAQMLLEEMRRIAEPNGLAIVGVDLKKDRAVLEAAYNDAKGVTADFNLNMLRHINRALDADFDLNAFEHDARYDADRGRVEMHLVSLEEQTVDVAGNKISFDKGESIHTENSYKYGIDQFAQLASNAGLDIESRWSDPRDYFGIFALRPAA